MKISRFPLCCVSFLWPVLALSQVTSEAPKITLINLGGSDCPPCLVWRALELPKLKAQADFRNVEFIHIEKSVMSAVPPRFFLAAEAKPYKDKLDKASGGMSGSPQVALLVDGEVHDYFFGTKSAEEMMLMIRSIQTGTPYPFERCVQRRDSRHCTVPGK